MVKLTIKLALVALVLNALYQGVPPYYTNWQFQDALKELASFPPFRATPEMMLDRCERIAKGFNLELTKDDFQVHLTASGKTATIDTEYTVVMKYIPGRPQPHTFTVHVEGDPPRFGSLTP